MAEEPKSTTAGQLAFRFVALMAGVLAAGWLLNKLADLILGPV